MKIPAKISRLFTLILFSLIFPAFIFAQNSESNSVFNLTAENLKSGNPVDASKAAWKYRAGDDPAWAATDFDDHEWRALNGSTGQLDKLLLEDWRGTGWFRLRFKTDESLRGKVVGMAIWQQLAASEIYLDGELVRRLGEIGNDAGNVRFINMYRTPFAVKLSDKDEHLLAVRYKSAIENPEPLFSKWSFSANAGNGFYLVFGNINEAVAQREQSQHSSYIVGVSRGGIYLAVGLLHLLLFWFYPPQRANLYFGIFAFLTAISNYLSYFQYASGEADLISFTVYRVFSRLLFLSYSLAFLLFLYRAFLPRTPRFFTAAAIVWTITNIVTLVFPQTSFANGLFGVMTVFFVAECLRVMWLAIRNRAEGAWIVAVGVLTSLIGPLRYLYLLVGLPISTDFDYYLGFVSSYGMLAAVSIYLARNFARTNKDLSHQLETVQALSARALEHERTEAELRLKHEQQRAENERRAKELEEAQRLQLSLLPKKLPELPNVEIAAYMKPATEVGGDYYDFYVGSDETLTFAVGDATGHGLRAGTMVTATKSLFNNLAADPVLPEILKSASVALKKMNLRGMFMAMTMARISGNLLQICQAGMPPALLFRRRTGAVEEFSSRALPLGAPLAKSYVQQETILAPGDCLVIMSDGFPEMFNERGDMLGFDRAAGILRESVHLSAAEIVQNFVSVGEKWAGSHPADDDVTFVVVKIAEISD
ncbi:MAG: PP2C family protein-serine/threonine phosphatase [Acidobacteriota bacterium]|nr:PP2C family protein-serine/threonine phosphatase [Acidobacteriota bacterium]